MLVVSSAASPVKRCVGRAFSTRKIYPSLHSEKESVMEEMNLEAFKLYNLSIAFSKTKTHTGSEIWLLTCSRRPSRRLRMYSLPVVPSHSGAPLPFCGALFPYFRSYWASGYLPTTSSLNRSCFSSITRKRYLHRGMRLHKGLCHLQVRSEIPL